jgi:hypothetical protein
MYGLDIEGLLRLRKTDERLKQKTDEEDGKRKKFQIRKPYEFD